jgi:hypothetical protein
MRAGGQNGERENRLRSAPSASAATAKSMDWSSASAAERVCDCGEGVQCPNERKPIFFIRIRVERYGV